MIWLLTHINVQKRIKVSLYVQWKCILLLFCFPIHTHGSTGWCWPSNSDYNLFETLGNNNGGLCGPTHTPTCLQSQGVNFHIAGQTVLPDLACKEQEVETDAPRATSAHQSVGCQLVITLNTGTRQQQATGDVQRRCIVRQDQTCPSDSCPGLSVNYFQPWNTSRGISDRS